MSVETFFKTLQQSVIDIWNDHLTSKKFDKHNILNEYYEDALDLVDDLIETYFGKNDVNFDLSEVESEIDPKVYNQTKSYLTQLRNIVEDAKDIELLGDDDENSELYSILDDFEQLIDTSLYKLSQVNESVFHGSSIKIIGIDEFRERNL